MMAELTNAQAALMAANETLGKYPYDSKEMPEAVCILAKKYNELLLELDTKNGEPYLENRRRQERAK